MEKIKHEEYEIPQRAPLKREAPVPLKGPPVLKNRLGALFDQGTGFHGGPSARRKGYRLALWSILASFIDGLILISLSAFFVMAFSLTMKASVAQIAQLVLHNQARELFFLEVFLVFGWIYMVTIRSLMGSTIGEWACELRLGQPHERLKTSYIFRVALRSSVILLTGVIPLPFLSLLIGKDLPGMISGLNLFSLK